MREIKRLTYNQHQAIIGQKNREERSIRSFIICTSRGCLYSFIEWTARPGQRDENTRRKLTTLMRKRFEQEHGEVKSNG